MNSRERIKMALNHKEADRVPIDLSSRSIAIEKEAYSDLKNYLGMSGPVETFIRSHAELDEEVLQLFNVDTRYVRSIPRTSWINDGEDKLFIDQWGVPWKKNEGSIYYDIAEFIHDKIEYEDIFKIEWASLLNEESLDDMEKKAKYLYETTEYSLITDVLGAGIFEGAWYMRGFEKLMMDMALDKKFINAYLEKVLEVQIEAYNKLLNKISRYIDCLLITDDLAMQNNLLISPNMYKEVIKPFQKQLIGFIQSRNVDVIYHTCGSIYPLLEDLVEIGVRILHPVQLSANGMDAEQLKREFGKQIVFWGGGSNTQETLQFGTPEKVKDEVRARLDILAPGGGYIFAPEHCIQAGTPPENIITMFETVKEYGRY